MKIPKSSNEFKSIDYELFIGALSLLSLINVYFSLTIDDQVITDILSTMNVLLSFIFVVDFFFRLFTAKSKEEYFLRQYGWADLLASIAIGPSRLFRVFRLYRIFKHMKKLGGRQVLRKFILGRGNSALFTVLLITILVFEFGSVAILLVESTSPEANITTASDAIWWVMTTVTTVGYGDTFPTTGEGRLIGGLVMVVGIGLFGTITGFLANAFLRPERK